MASASPRDHIIGTVSPSWVRTGGDQDRDPEGGGHPATKQCFDCGQDLPLGYFGKNHSTADGRERRCMSCQRVYERSLPLVRKRTSGRGAPGGTKYTNAVKGKLSPLEAYPTGLKTCTRCGAEKPLSAFPNNRHGMGGLNPVCRACKYGKGAPTPDAEGTTGASEALDYSGPPPSRKVSDDVRVRAAFRAAHPQEAWCSYHGAWLPLAAFYPSRRQPGSRGVCIAHWNARRNAAASAGDEVADDQPREERTTMEQPMTATATATATATPERPEPPESDEDAWEQEAAWEAEQEQARTLPRLVPPPQHEADADERVEEAPRPAVPVAPVPPIANISAPRFTVREWLDLEQVPSVLTVQAQSDAEAAAGLPTAPTCLLYQAKDAPVVMLTDDGRFGSGASLAPALARALIGHWSGTLFY